MTTLEHRHGVRKDERQQVTRQLERIVPEMFAGYTFLATEKEYKSQRVKGCGKPDHHDLVWLHDRLDTVHGIDAYIIPDGWRRPNHRIVGDIYQVGTRYQFDFSFRTFTIRTRTGWGSDETERAKLRRAVVASGDIIRPQLTLQAYSRRTADGPVVEAVGIIATRLLVDREPDSINQAPGGAKFDVHNWTSLVDEGAYARFWGWTP